MKKINLAMPRVFNKLLKIIQPFITVTCIIFLSVNYYTPLVLAAINVTETPNSPITEVPDETASPSITPFPEETIQPTITVVSTQVPAIINENTNNQVNISAIVTNEAKVNSWIINNLGTEYSSKYPIELNALYDLPNNDNVAIKFNKLPEQQGYLKFKEIKLNPEQQVKLKTLSESAYEITTDMENGSFSYELILPNSFKKNADLQIKYAKNFEELVNSNQIIKPDEITENYLKASHLDHFTVFVVFNPNNGVNDVSVGTIAWLNATNVIVSDDNFASVPLNGTDDVSNYLIANSFDFSAIPALAIIEGIEFRIEKSSTGTETFDNEVRIIKNGVIGGLASQNKADANAWDLNDTFITYGSANDLWGETWTISEFNNIGLAVSARRNSGSPDQTANIDHIRIGVYYNTIPEITVTAPNGGQAFAAGSTQLITWQYIDQDLDTIAVDLDYSLDNGINWNTIATGLIPASGSFNWNIPAGLNSNTSLIRATISDPSGSVNDTSDAVFIIDGEPPVVDISPDEIQNIMFIKTPTAVSDSGSGISAYNWSLDTPSPGNITFGSPLSSSTSILADTDGLYSLRLRVTDNVGLFTEATFQLTWDTTAPAIPDSVIPVNNSFVQSSMSLRDWTDVVDVNGPVTYIYQHSLNPGINPVDNSLQTPILNSGILNNSQFSVPILSESTYYWQVRACDSVNSGNCSNWSGPWVVTVDDTPPSVNAGSDVLASFASFIQNGTASDSSGIANVSWTQQSGAGTVIFNPSINLSTEISANIDGSYLIRLTATDNAGNSSLDEMVYTRDTEPPFTDLVTPANDSFFNTAIIISGTSQDNIAVNNVILSYRAAGTSDPWVNIIQINNSPISNPFNWQNLWTPVAEGIYDIRAYAIDMAGNIESTDFALNVTYDVTAPTVPGLASPPNGAVIQPSLAIFDWFDVSDNLTDVFYYYQSSLNPTVGVNNGLITPLDSQGPLINSIVNATTLSDNIYYWQVRACDSTGNCSNWSGPWQVIIDGTAPQVNAGTDKVINGAVNQDATASDNLAGILSYEWSQISGPVGGTNNFNTPNFEDTIISADIDGFYTIRLTVTDFAGNVSFDEAIINWDTTVPATPTWLSPIDGAITKINNSIFFRWNTVNDNGSGIAGYEYEISGPNSYFINTKIACGNMLIPPTQTQIPNSLIGPGAICLQGNYALLPNIGGDPNSPGGGDGIYTRKIRAYDNAGNVSGWGSATIIRDTQRPASAIQSVSPLFNSMYSNTRILTFNVSVNDTLSGVKSVTIYTFILGFPLPIGTCTNFSACTITALPSDGAYLFYSLAEDFADDLTAADVYLANNGDDGKGNIEIKNTAEISVIIDTDPPEATITSHSDGQTLKGTILITGAVFDPNLWRYNFVVVNSGNTVVAGPGTVNNNGPSVFPEFPWNTTLVPDGNYIIKLEARDKATNKSCGAVPCPDPVINDPNDQSDSIDWVNIIVDNTPPTTNVFIQGQLDYNSPAYPPLIRTDNNGWYGFGWYEIFNFVRLNIASGNPSDLIKFRLVNGNANCPAVNSATYTSVINATDISAQVNALGEGTHKLCYFGYDLVNNIEPGAPKQILLKLDNSNPDFNITNATGNLVNGVYYNNTTTQNVQIRVTDNLAGYRLAQYNLYDASCLNPISLNEDIFNTGAAAQTNISRTLSLTSLSDGSYCLRIQVFDDVQNKSTIQNVFFVIDTQAPSPPEWLQTPIYTRVDGLGGTQNIPLDFTESTSTDIAAYEFQSVIVNLDNTSKQTFVGLINPVACIITDSNIENCNFNISTNNDIRLIYRLRAVDLSGNKSLWTNWNKDGITPLSTADFANFNGENFTYDDYLGRSDAFAFANGYASTENGGLAIREAITPVSNITTVLPQPYFTNISPITVDYEAVDTDTGISFVNLAYIFNGSDQGIYLIHNYSGEVNVNRQSAAYQSFSFDFPNGDGEYCFYTIAEDIANNLPIDNGLGNLEAVKTCKLTVNFDQTSPIINQVVDTTFNEGDPIPRQDSTFNIVAQRAQTDIDKLCYSINGTFERCIPDNGSHIWNIWDFEAIPIVLPGVWWGLDYFDTAVLPEDTYYIQYYVIDLAQNQSDVFNTVITIENAPPRVQLQNQNPEPLFEGDTAMFTGSFTDPSCTPNATLPCLNVLNYVPDDSDWLLNIDYGDGVKLNLGSVSVPKQLTIPDHAYFVEGTYTVTLTIKESDPANLNSQTPAFATGNGEGKIGSKSITINVANAVPVVSISADPGTNVNSGTKVTLKANVSLGNLPYAYSWYGNCSGNSDSFILPRRAGIYNCGVLVIDSDGDYATAEIQVIVNKLPVTVIETIIEENNILGEEENLLQLCLQKSKISGYVFRDNNNNGTMDINETGVKDIQVKIMATINNEEKVIVLLRSSFDGYYEYDICPGNYRIEINRETLPVGFKTVNDNILNININEDEELADLNFAISEITLPVNYWTFVIPLLLLGFLVLLLKLINRSKKGYTVEYR